MPQLPNAPQFCLSASSHHGLQRAEEGLPLGQQQLGHLLHLPALASHQRSSTGASSSSAAAALPCRYYTTPPGFLFPERSEVPRQAFGFAPVFSLACTCSSSSRSAGTAAALSHDCVIALRPAGELARLPPAHSAALVLQQHRRQQELCAQDQQQQQQQKRKGRHKDQQQQQQQQQQASSKPWLGAALDVGGYTKRGFISGGGKDQNQDRGLILEEFRTPNELLLGVMDGHGTSGHLVSAYLAQHLPAVLMQKLVAAAAAALGSSRDAERQPKQRKLFGSSPAKQQQQQSQQDLQLAVSQVPYVVVPDHWPKYGFTPAQGAVYAGSGSSSSSSSGDAAPQAPVHSPGRPVAKQQVVEQQLHSHPLGDADSSSSSSSSSRSSFTHSSSNSSSQKWLSPVSHQLLQQVPLSQAVLADAFTATDFHLSGSGINVVDSGSTALLCHIGPRSITTAWVGDSRAVLGRRRRLLRLGSSTKQQQRQPGQQQATQRGQGGDAAAQQQQQAAAWEAIPLSVDHKPERHDEYLRINLNEGRVAQIMGRGPYRVWFKGTDYPGLAMSRAFGDLPCRRIGVCVEPEVTVHPLRPEDELLVAASDGIWDVLSNEEVVALAGEAPGAAAAARALVEVAEARWLETEGGYIDDITAVVLRASPAGK